MPAASHGSTPCVIASAAITAEKLKFQPTERSISPSASRNTDASAIIPKNELLATRLSRFSGWTKALLCVPTTTTSRTSAAKTPSSSGNTSRRRDVHLLPGALAPSAPPSSAPTGSL